MHGHHHAYHRRVQAVWHGRPRQGHGTITSLEMVGGTVGAIVSGVLFDVTGSFASTWIVCLACSVVMLVFLLASEPIAAKLRASVAGE
ncbi:MULTISPECIES: major facilitator superfamily domain-containing protein 7 [unclassified Collinsella]|uniref:major facilitator superfamily domain-containing protein 7 n=1 Tax=unclassified Collinsella TaxID=2637548 RepID=UPI0011C17FA6|nr:MULTISPECIES: major facilitator superfamily domain-containing protein 7 [unclassified Collinsella]